VDGKIYGELLTFSTGWQDEMIVLENDLLMGSDIL